MMRAVACSTMSSGAGLSAIAAATFGEDPLVDWPRLAEDVCVLCRPGCELEAEDALREYVRRVLAALLRSQHDALCEESQLASLLAETLQAIAAPRCPELPL